MFGVEIGKTYVLQKSNSIKIRPQERVLGLNFEFDKPEGVGSLKVSLEESEMNTGCPEVPYAACPYSAICGIA